MKDMVQWLIGIEDAAGGLYQRAGEFFHDKPDLSHFFLRLSEDEAWHFHAMASAAEFLRKHPESRVSSVSVDEETRNRIERPLRRNLERLNAGTLSEREILECLHETEFSEWNDLFLYVLNSLKERSREFQVVAARLHNHLKSVEEFLATRPGGERYGEALSALPPVWEERVLVVDDDDAVRMVIAAILSKQATVETARDGREGLEKLKAGYYDAVVSDVNMPVMDGIRFYENAVAQDPTAKKRFLFYAGSVARELEIYFRDKGLPFLEKPAPISDLRNTVARLVRKGVTESP